MPLCPDLGSGNRSSLPSGSQQSESEISTPSSLLARGKALQLKQKNLFSKKGKGPSIKNRNIPVRIVTLGWPTNQLKLGNCHNCLRG